MTTLAALLAGTITFVEAVFLPGRIPLGENEYPELSGRMTVRAAVSSCETDAECAGFTFMGAPELDAIRHVGFFRFVPRVSAGEFRDLDWNR